MQIEPNPQNSTLPTNTASHSTSGHEILWTEIVYYTSFQFIANLNILPQTNGGSVLGFSVFWSRNFKGRAVAADSIESYLK
jgi:hypothetical protein